MQTFDLKIQYEVTVLIIIKEFTYLSSAIVCQRLHTWPTASRSGTLR